MSATPAPTRETARCETCRWWDQPFKTANGKCRRYPATRDPHSSDGKWPWTERDDFCGEHQPRPGAQP